MESQAKQPLMRVLLTGGYGCIGAWIVRNLFERGHQVSIYDLKEDPRRLRLIMPEEKVRQVQFIQGDVTDQKNLERAMGDHGITHVVHLAGLQVPTCRADPILGAKVNVIGTLAVFAARSRVCRRVVLGSRILPARTLPATSEVRIPASTVEMIEWQCDPLLKDDEPTP